MKRFLDNIATEIIELALIYALSSHVIFRQGYEMAPELVAHIAGGFGETQIHRDKLKRQLEVLSRGAETCRQFAVKRFSGDSIIFILSNERYPGF